LLKVITTFEKQKPVIEKKLRQTNSESLDELEISVVLKRRYNFQQNDSIVYRTLAELETNGSSTLFIFDGDKESVESYHSFLSSNSISNNLENYNRFVFGQLIAREESRITTKDAEVSYLIREYDEGLLLFEIMDDIVWSKAVKDTVGLEAFYRKNIDNYWQDSAVRIARLSPEVVSPGVKEGLVDRLADVSINADSLRAFAIQNNLIFEEEILDSKASEIASLPESQFINVINTEGVFAIVILESIPASHVELDEIKGQVITDYQNYLDREWIKELRENSVLEVNTSELEKLYSKYAKQ
jgi:peptidyl-prolyl cis-trans isomerase SurA